MQSPPQQNQRLGGSQHNVSKSADNLWVAMGIQVTQNWVLFIMTMTLTIHGKETIQFFYNKQPNSSLTMQKKR